MILSIMVWLNMRCTRRYSTVIRDTLRKWPNFTPNKNHTVSDNFDKLCAWLFIELVLHAYFKT